MNFLSKYINLGRNWSFPWIAWMIVIISSLLSISGCSRDIPPSLNNQVRLIQEPLPPPELTPIGISEHINPDNLPRQTQKPLSTPELRAPRASEYIFTPTPVGRTIIVSNNLDSGYGTLRQALLDAQIGDTITFDQQIFRPTNQPPYSWKIKGKVLLCQKLTWAI